MTKTIVLIHRAWLNAKTWEGFEARFEAKKEVGAVEHARPPRTPSLETALAA